MEPSETEANELIVKSTSLLWESVFVTFVTQVANNPASRDTRALEHRAHHELFDWCDP